MSEKSTAGLINEPQNEHHHLRCQTGHHHHHQLQDIHHDQGKHMALLPMRCANICVTTNDKRESSLRKSTTTIDDEDCNHRDDCRPFSFHVVTVIDPEALSTYSTGHKPTLRTAIRSIHKRHREYADNLRKNIIFHSSSSTSYPKRERFTWRKEPGSANLRRVSSRYYRHRSYAGQDSHNSPVVVVVKPTAAKCSGTTQLKHCTLDRVTDDRISPADSTTKTLDDEIKQDVTKLVRDNLRVSHQPAASSTLLTESIGSQHAENAINVRGVSFAADQVRHRGQVFAQQKSQKLSVETTDQQQQSKPSGLRLIKKKKKRKKSEPPEKKKVNLLKFKQKIPVTGTGYEMELFLERDIIDSARIGKIDITKEPLINVNYNKSADLRDEFSSYCSQRKKLKNWLFYA